MPNVEKGEVLVDSRGEGSFQRARFQAYVVSDTS
jgi:hypothetical protein